MKLGNLFVCFTKTGERCVICRVTKFNNKIANVYYYDIINDRVIPNKDIDFSTLVPFRNYSKSKDNDLIISKKRVCKIFSKDNQIEYYSSNLAYYNIYRVLENGNLKLIKENVLLRKYSNNFQEWYVDIVKNEVVSIKSYNYDLLPDKVVYFVRNVSLDGCRIPKKKILEMDYKKEL